MTCRCGKDVGSLCCFWVATGVGGEGGLRKWHSIIIPQRDIAWRGGGREMLQRVLEEIMGEINLRDAGKILSVVSFCFFCFFSFESVSCCSSRC